MKYRKNPIKTICLLFLAVVLLTAEVAPVTVAAKSSSKKNFFGALPVYKAKAVTDHPRILFVGNSLTFRNNSPDMVKKICEANGIYPEIQMVVRSSYSLYEFVYPNWFDEEGLELSDRLKKLLKQEKWDYVVLQDQRCAAVKDTAKMKKAVSKLQPLIKNAGAQMVLMMTWAPKMNRFDYKGSHAVASNPNEFLTKVSNTYYSLGKKYKAAVAPSGIAFMRSQSVLPNIGLYKSDTVHPTVAGSYLSACVIYATLFGKSPEGTSYYPDISGKSETECAEIGSRLQALAADVTVRGKVSNQAKLLFSSKKVSMTAGEIKKISYRIQKRTTGSRITYWKSSKPSVAAVNQEGKVTALRAGTAKITAKLNNNASAVCTVKVTGSAGSTVKNTKLIHVGKTAKLKVNLGSSAVKYSSSKPSVVAVNQKGVVTAKRAGTVKITVKAGNGKKAVYTVKSIIPAKKIAFANAKGSFAMEKGETRRLNISFSPKSATIKKMKWRTSDSDVVTVTKDGAVKAVGKGMAYVAASTTDGSNLRIKVKISVK